MKSSFLIAVAALAAVVLTGCTASLPRDPEGNITAPADVGALQIQMGDCTATLTNGGIKTIPVVPCSDKHSWEVFDSIKVGGEEFPGNSVINAQAETFCIEAFTSFVGLPPSESKYRLFYLSASEETWKAGDRSILCLVGAETGDVTGSLKGVAQ